MENEGIIKKISEKGFGFITVQGRSKDLFFHSSKVKTGRFTELKEGDVVTFDSIRSEERGEAAVGVELKTE